MLQGRTQKKKKSITENKPIYLYTKLNNHSQKTHPRVVAEK
jgi:hypothetical protein